MKLCFQACAIFPTEDWIITTIYKSRLCYKSLRLPYVTRRPMRILILWSDIVTVKIAGRLYCIRLLLLIK